MAARKKALIGLIIIATIIVATKSVITLHFKPWRQPQITIGSGQTKFTKAPSTGTYILINAITIAIAARMPASTMADVLRITG